MGHLSKDLRELQKVAARIKRQREAEADLLGDQLGIGVQPNMVVIGITKGPVPRAICPTPVDAAEQFAMAVIRAAGAARAEAARLDQVKAQAQAELSASSQEETPGEPSPAPHTEPSSPGPIIVLPGAP